MIGGEFMVRLRLRRMGTKKKPMYRIVAAETSCPRNGRFIEILGHYNPRATPPALVLDKEKAMEWLKKGAQPSEKVKKLLSQAGN